jgi:hypothetical protein
VVALADGAADSEGALLLEDVGGGSAGASEEPLGVGVGVAEGLSVDVVELAEGLTDVLALAVGGPEVEVVGEAVGPFDALDVVPRRSDPVVTVAILAAVGGGVATVWVP